MGRRGGKKGEAEGEAEGEVLQCCNGLSSFYYSKILACFKPIHLDDILQ